MGIKLRRGVVRGITIKEREMGEGGRDDGEDYERNEEKHRAGVGIW